MDTLASSLPVLAVMPQLRQSLCQCSRCILEAPPGAGKTSRLPLALLEHEKIDGWLQGRSILMLEPRRMAARTAAAYMARLLGEPLGQTVGYEVRLDRRPGSRITIVTEGILTRRLQEDPELSGVGCLIFDEFHERNLNADLGLALALDCQEALREDLRILIMSATLDSAPLQKLLGGPGESLCPLVRSEGRIWPVTTRYFSSLRQNFGLTVGSPANRAGRNEELVAEAVRLALTEEKGSLLVFLPGARELQKVKSLLEDSLPQGIALHLLHGELPLAAQEAAIAPPEAGRRKIVLSTAIAETSLTIEGVGVVIDAGWSRFARFDSQRGMGRLVTGRVSLAEAEQRKGRAGRTGPGVCYRLWDQREEAAFRPSRRAEILEADLTSLCLDLAVWGLVDASALAWLDPPPPEALGRGRELLLALGAVDTAGRATPRGRLMAALPMHPRLAHMVLEAKERGLGTAACLLAALAGERDPLRSARQTVDLRLRLALFGERGRFEAGRSVVSGALLKRIEDAARQIARRAGLAVKSFRLTDEEIEQSGLLLALAYPDRVARRRSRGSFRMVNGGGAVLDPADALADEAFLAIGALNGESGDARIFDAAPVAVPLLEEVFAERVQWRDDIGWNAREEAVLARRERCFGALVLEAKPLSPVPEQACRAAVCAGIRSLGLACLPWTPEQEDWRRRVCFLRALNSPCEYGSVDSLSRPPCAQGDNRALSQVLYGFPDLADAVLLDKLEVWLEPFLSRISRRTQFKNIDLAGALHALLTWEQRRILEREAPSHLEVPSGSRIRLDYPTCGETGKIWQKGQAGSLAPPVLAVKVQEMFGLRSTPTVACGRVPVLVHLLSPAGRPLQITSDLEGFWQSSYPAIRAEMRGRYPRHPWPDDPAHAVPTRRAKPRF